MQSPLAPVRSTATPRLTWSCGDVAVKVPFAVALPPRLPLLAQVAPLVASCGTSGVGGRRVVAIREREREDHAESFRAGAGHVDVDGDQVAGGDVVVSGVDDGGGGGGVAE